MTDDPVRLRNAQQEIRDAYFQHDSGLYVLACVPGAGKSEVSTHIPAENLLRLYVAGEPAPEQRIAVISFNRSEASSIVPDLCSRLREIVEHDLAPIAEEVSTEEVEYLIQRVRQAPHIGTIDSILRDILAEFATDIGFSEMPVVGNTARLQELHSSCYQAIRKQSETETPLDRLEAAYPDEEYTDSVADILASALKHCRDRRISTDDFEKALQRTFDNVYPDGRPESFDDVVAAIDRCVGDVDEATLSDEVDADERDAIAAADARLYDDWQTCLDDLCSVLAEYRRTYRRRIRERDDVSHTDVAYLVDSYFSGHLDAGDPALRERIKQRYHARIQSLIIDEAQDVAAGQHAALSHLVSPETRVFAAGDVLQSIYLWRNAEPTLFETAIRDGAYLGIDWNVHETRTATTTYRCVPDVARAINEIAEPALTDPAQGNIGELDVEFPGLDPYRDPTDHSNVHIAAFEPVGRDMDSYAWVNPTDGRGEATTVAALISKGLGDGTFTDDDGEPLGISVLFRWSSKMETYANAFEEEGLTVRNASENLFECSVVEAVLDVCDWLSSPADGTRTRTLITQSPLGLQSLEDDFKRRDWDIDAVLDDCDLTDVQRHHLSALSKLSERRDICLSRPAGTYVADIIDALALRADPFDWFDVEPAQRVANLDALIETIADWEVNDHLSPRELSALITPFRENPYMGPNQPSTPDTSHDVEFRTVHDAKGDQDDVVVLANPGFDVWQNGPQSQRFLTQGDIAGLAPPTNTNCPSNPLPPFDSGLYDPEDTRGRDVGLRWATNHWCDDVATSSDPTSLVGHDLLEGVAANGRAEAWRLLYVALTRAKDHLVIPLPRSLPVDSSQRDRWLDTIREALGFTGDETSSYTVEPEAASNDDPFEIGVNDVPLTATWDSPSASYPDDVAVSPPRRDELGSWIPRFVRPSTLYPLTEDPDGQVLNHLLGTALHTDANDVPDEVTLPFGRMGPGDIGTCYHDVLTTLIENQLSESALRNPKSVRRLFDDVVDDHTSRLDDVERRQLFTFFHEEVLTDFLASNLWQQIQRAERVTVERPIDGVVPIDDVEIEIHGTADLVIESPDGDRSVADLKIALTEQTPATRRRYELQVAAYSYLFEQQDLGGQDVRQRVETFGVERTTVESSWPAEIVEHRLASLVRS